MVSRRWLFTLTMCFSQDLSCPFFSCFLLLLLFLHKIFISGWWRFASIRRRLLNSLVSQPPPLFFCPCVHSDQARALVIPSSLFWFFLGGLYTCAHPFRMVLFSFFFIICTVDQFFVNDFFFKRKRGQIKRFTRDLNARSARHVQLFSRLLLFSADIFFILEKRKSLKSFWTTILFTRFVFLFFFIFWSCVDLYRMEATTRAHRRSCSSSSHHHFIEIQNKLNDCFFPSLQFFFFLLWRPWVVLMCFPGPTKFVFPLRRKEKKFPFCFCFIPYFFIK